MYARDWGATILDNASRFSLQAMSIRFISRTHRHRFLLKNRFSLSKNLPQKFWIHAIKNRPKGTSIPNI